MGTKEVERISEKTEGRCPEDGGESSRGRKMQLGAVAGADGAKLSARTAKKKEEKSEDVSSNRGHKDKGVPSLTQTSRTPERGRSKKGRTYGKGRAFLLAE